MPVIPFRSPKTPPRPFTVEPPPAPSRRTLFVQWLRKMHGWIGLWGAVLGLLFGGTSILLNHRTTFSIPAAQTREDAVQVPVPSPAPATPQAMAGWLQRALRLEPVPDGLRAEPARPVTWNGQSVVQPARWSASFASPSGNVQAEYWVGNSYVTLRRIDDSILATLARLHKGIGTDAAWVLLVDALAGSIILLSLSGVTLWAFTHKRNTVGIAFGTLSLVAVGGVALATLY